MPTLGIQTSVGEEDRRSQSLLLRLPLWLPMDSPLRLFTTYPRSGTPEFCVKASAVGAAMRIQWYSGMRFKMAFETEDSSRISWFMGTISSVQVTWDKPDLLQNVKRVSPWLVELASNVPPTIHLSPFSPPRKKFRLPHYPDFPLDGQFPMSLFSSNTLGPSSPLCCLSYNTPTGIQGARHAQISVSLSDLHLNKLQAGLFSDCFQRIDRVAPSSRISNGIIVGNSNGNDSVSCLLTMGNSTQSSKKSDEGKTPHFVLFGQPIHTEQQISLSFSGDTVSPSITGNSSSDGNPERTANLSDGFGSVLNQHGMQENSSSEGYMWYKDHQTTDLCLETSHCKVFVESEDVGRSLDLSALGSYEELYRKLADMFDLERSEVLNHVLYRDATGAVKHTGEKPFSEFMKTARRLTVLMDSGSDNIGRDANLPSNSQIKQEFPSESLNDAAYLLISFIAKNKVACLLQATVKRGRKC